MSNLSENLVWGRNLIGIVVAFILLVLVGILVADLFDWSVEYLILGIVAVAFVAILAASIKVFE